MTPSFLLILDISGSMYGEMGEKIMSLNQVVDNLKDGLKIIKPEPTLAVITYGEVVNLENNFIPISQIPSKIYEARGKSQLTEAVRLASSITTEDVITILISDGNTLDSSYSRIPLKGHVYAIGLDADYEQLARFTGSNNRVLPPYAANDLPGYVLQKVFG